MKSVGVFCSSSDAISPFFLEEAHNLGAHLAQNQMTVIYGGAHTGAMGSLAAGVLENNGRIIGVYPSLELGHEKSHQSLSDMVTVKTMAERKQILFEKSDGFIIAPGGVGTLDEMFELIVLRFLHESSPDSSLSMHHKPVVLLNTLNFWDPLIECLKIMVEQKFLYQSLDQLFEITDDIKTAVQLLKK